MKNYKINPMLATLLDEPFDSPDWIFEPKWDGERILAYFDGGDVVLVTRYFRKVGFRYPEIVEGLKKAVLAKQALLDGELVALDSKNHPSFSMFQKRMGLNEKAEIKARMREIPLYLYLFDTLSLNGKSTENLSLLERKKLLKKTIKEQKHIKLTDYIVGSGKSFFRKCKNQGMEGIVAKKKDSIYQEGKRGKNWLKIKAVNQQEVVIGGYTKGTGSRVPYFGSLLLGVYEGKKLIFIGGTGTGFDEKILKELTKKLKKLRTNECPFEGNPKIKDALWVRPKLVAQVKFQQWTGKKMRIPVYLGLRDDKQPKEVHFEGLKK